MKAAPIPPRSQPSPSRDQPLLAPDQYLAPHGLLTRLMYRATRVRTPWFKRWQINWFIRRYGVDISQAEQPDLEAYPDFNTFFTRALKPDARPLPADPATLISPVDGTVSQAGAIAGDRLFQAKGHDYPLRALLAGAADYAPHFEGGLYATIYLAPRDYHRVHMPCDGTLREMHYVPGRLFSVSPRTTAAIPGLFARNERLVMLFDTACGPMAVIMVGAMLVAGIETVWSGLVVVNHREAPRRWDYVGRSVPLHLERGAELGRFNMGSTVIVLLPPGCAELAATVQADATMRMGETLATRLRP